MNMTRRIRFLVLGLLISTLIYLVIFLVPKDTPNQMKVRMRLFEQQELYIINMTKVKVPVTSTLDESFVVNSTSAVPIFNISSTEAIVGRPPFCNGCFHLKFRFLINSKVCDGSDARIDLLILITTAPSALVNRMALRRSWLSPIGFNNDTTRYVFLLGESSRNGVFENIQEENEVYHDIVMANFTDSYDNLTYKTKMGFYWATTMCPNAKFVMKTDHDVLVNVRNINKLTNMFSNKLQTTIFGSCWAHKPVRNPRSKYYIGYDQYPNESYPTFCSGTGYVTSMTVVRKIYQISQDIPFFKLEDVYVAFCREKIGLKTRSIRGFFNKFDICFFQRNTTFTAHSYPPRRMLSVWHAKCTSLDNMLRPSFVMKRRFISPRKRPQ